MPAVVESQLASLLEAAPDAMVGVDQSGAIRFVNRQTEVMFGYHRDQLIGQPIETLVPESFRGVHPGHRTRYFADRRTRPMGVGLQLSGRRQDGTEFPVDISLSSIETEDGVLVTAAVRDITDRRRVQAKFESLLEAAPDAMVGVDRSGIIRFVNRQTQVMFGYRRDELIGQPIETLVPESFRGVHPGHRTRYFSDPRTRPMGVGLELSGRRRDGSEFPVDISLSSIETEDGVLVTAAVRDITERRTADEALHRMRALIESTDDAVIGKTLDGVILSWNGGAERLFGYASADVIGGPISLLIPDGHVDEVPELLARIGGGQRVVHYETTRRRKDGEVIDVSLTVSPIRDLHGNIVGASTIARDISERKRMDRALVESEKTIRALNADLERRVEERTAELLAANRELEAFSYSVSHDLRAPLRAIDGFSRILLEDHAAQLDAEGQRVLKVICDGATGMATLIDDLLAFSRLGRQHMQTTPIDMQALAETVARELAINGPGSATPAISVEELPFAEGDQGMVRQVFVNLISNAIKFTAPRTSPTIEVGGRVDGDDGVYWVRDNGVGFDDRYKEKLFQVFQRLHTSEFEGTGVGLAIVHRIVSRHGGQIWAESELGKGACFYFTLPLATGRP